ncbi:predicted protein [Chaetoceros tenuissimus]|uniref:MYND-type domain-containing protein n=1 Tax=Chaetoceros tenuissimus TaxID=426638 RepID=A0AAD3H7I3_9STRA|nr:predicted protein [Chaetoceros tenuissimus]
MGKKSKRRWGNRNQTNQTQTRGIPTANTKDEFERIERAVKSLYEDSCDMHRKCLYSQAHEKLSKIAALLEAKKGLLMKKHLVYYKQTNVYAYEKIANLEVRQRNFEAVISIYDFCESIVTVTDKLYLFYCLALMVTGRKDWYQATGAALKYAQYAFSVHQSDQSKPHLHPRKAHLALLGPYWNFFLVELRRMKKWDEALDFTNKFGIYIEGSKFFASAFLHVATYIERYRVEAQKRPRDERNKMSVSLYKYIFAKIGDGFAKFETRKVGSHPYMVLLGAQWLYLNHHGTKEQRVKEIDTAIFIVEKYIKTQYEDTDTVMHNCLGCEQKSTTSDPLLVCSGCRVVCYCGLDHQRSSWKKELHWGKSHGKNTYEYHSRFQRECEKFLSDGLGLNDLCFSQDFVDKNGEEFRFAKWRTALSRPRGF